MIKAIKDKVVAVMMTREKTRSGIIIPDSVQEPQAFSQVISVGEDVSTIKEDDIIVSHIRSGMDVVIDKEIIKVLKEDEVYGILSDKETINSLQEIELKRPKEKSNIIQGPGSKLIQ